jgi:signal transduction histidine kinase
VIYRYTLELRQLNDEKNEFMGIAAHDLRNPLSAIKGYSEMILEDAQGGGQTEIEENSRRIRSMAERMVEMVQNLLDANRIERGEMKMEVKPSDLRGVVETVAGTQRPRAGAKQQNLQIDFGAGPFHALVDPSVMVQVLENLVSNAIKYSPTGKTIWLRLVPTAECIRCEVQDEGPGLTPDDQKKLFGKFARLSAKPTGGELATGLGLSIVKKMIEAMHGRVWCESQQGQGATFIVQVPAATAD